MSPSDCILIIPASGFSRRFGEADKLLADFHGRPLADYAAETAAKAGFARMIAVLPPEHAARAQIFKARGCEIVENPSAALGHSHSIHMGVKAITNIPKAICIMLADMPLVPLAHIHALVGKAPQDGVIKTLYEGQTQPPAVFTGRAMHAWLRPDSPALKASKASLRLAAPLGDDVDTASDLERLSNLLPK